MSLDAIIFDLDGTLVDSREDLANSVKAAFERLDLPVPGRERVIASVGHGARYLVRDLLPEEEPEEALVDRVIVAFRDHYLEHLIDHTRAFPGLPEVVRELGERVPLAVLTNKPGEMARRIIEGLDWSSAFRMVLGPDDVGGLKPDPVGLRLVLSRLEVEASRSVYVGDMPVDVEVARAAGTHSVAVNWGLCEPGILRAAAPDRLLDRVEELRELLELS